jgi:peptide/bleomycin uptake transporter
VFRSFFPVPRLFFSSAVIWALLLTALWFTAGEQIRGAISIDRFVVPPICAVTATPTGPAASKAAPAGAPAAATGAPPSGGTAAVKAAPPSGATAAPAAPTGATATTAPIAPAGVTPAVSGTNAQAAATVAAATAPAASCLSPDDDRFLSGAKVWQYEFVTLGALLFGVFWFFYKRNEWYWWSVGVTIFILLTIFYNVQISAWINNWYNSFYDLIQLALSGPGKVTAAQYYSTVFSALTVVVVYILAQAFIQFATSNYVFRWRKAMNFYYMSYWPKIRTYEGAAQRVQEDTQRFADIVEGLGTTFVSSFMSLLVFAPLLWTLSSHMTTVPVLGSIPGSLMWLALLWSAFGTILFAVAGLRLPGLNFQNQRVEAAYRKELVYGEDDPERAQLVVTRQLFANLQRNYIRLYLNYLYFNVVRYAYLQVDNFFILLFFGPTIVAAAITLGLFQQISSAFGQVTGSFQFLANSWTTVVELQSVRKRLKDFESHIPADSTIDTEPPLPAPEAGY